MTAASQDLHDPEEAARAWAALAAAGGIATRSDLARRWSVSTERARQITTSPTFPAPIAEVSGGPVWLVAQADAWRARRGRPGRPPAPPRA